MNCFIGTIPGSVAETSALAALVGAAILIWTGIGSWRIISSFIVGGLVMGAIFNLLSLNAYMTIGPVHQIVMGGFMFGAVFMATDPVSAAQTSTGKWVYGFLGGLFSIMIRVFNPAYPEGVMMAILFMNVMAPTIDHYVDRSQHPPPRKAPHGRMSPDSKTKLNHGIQQELQRIHLPLRHLDGGAGRRDPRLYELVPQALAEGQCGRKENDEHLGRHWCAQ